MLANEYFNMPKCLLIPQQLQYEICFHFFCFTWTLIMYSYNFANFKLWAFPAHYQFPHPPQFGYWLSPNEVEVRLLFPVERHLYRVASCWTSHDDVYEFDESHCCHIYSCKSIRDNEYACSTSGSARINSYGSHYCENIWVHPTKATGHHVLRRKIVSLVVLRWVGILRCVLKAS